MRSISMRNAGRWLALGLLVGAALTLARPSHAQATGGAIWLKSGCADCHGNLAAGDGDPAYPQGPSLRRTTLSRDDLRDVIACGRPDTDMPYHLATAYTQTACFGLPVGAVPGRTRRGIAMTAPEIDTLADFLATSVKGQMRITRASCALFVGNANDPACAQYPAQ
jgi:hypothetical protein